MAQISFEDLISDGYTFPGTGGSLVITISGDEGVISFEISGLNQNIIGFSATEGGSEVEVIEDEPGADYVVQLTGEEDAEITIEVSENPSTTYDSEAFSVYYQTSEEYSQIVIGQDGYTPPPPPWEDGFHKIYRSGQQVMKMYRSGELIYLRLNPAGEEPTPPDYRSMPLTFKIISGGTISWRATSASFTKEIRYSVNDGPWVSITSTTAGTPISLNTGDIVKFKGDGAISTSSSNPNRFRDSTIVFEVYGNIMSLIDSTGYTTATTAADHSFRQLFAAQSGLTSAEHLVLPATTIGTNVYKDMFKDCTSLMRAPELPATTLAQSCYFGMFQNCISLTEAPELPATILAQECYKQMFSGCTSLTTAPSSIGTSGTSMANSACTSMFQGCTSLTTAPSLPATTLANYCYYNMFSHCTSLTTAPELPATTLANNCYQNMFYGCTSLITIPTNYLPARTLTQRCYGDMFHNCSSLTAAPELPATTLSSNCYRSMFDGCTSLTSAPAILPATIITPTYCYQYMFRGCSSLTTAPELPATTLSSGCYYQMFNGCTNLNYIKCLATDISATNCTRDWVNGVAATGTFETPSSTNWTTDTSGIPSGWTRVDA